MAIMEGWLPPSRENWELMSYIFQLFPLVSYSRSTSPFQFLTLLQITIAQWFVSWNGMGKTSVVSRFNLPGKIGWLTMESPGFILLLYLMFTLPAMNGIKELPLENKIMAALFVSSGSLQKRHHELFNSQANLCRFLSR